jgi:hypothetical protein
VVVPVIAATTGSAFTVIDLVAVADPQALVTVYDISTVPADAPPTCPFISTVAIALFPLAHTPPVVASVSVIELPTHTDDVAAFTVPAETVFTVTGTTVDAPVQPPEVTRIL